MLLCVSFSLILEGRIGNNIIEYSVENHILYLFLNLHSTIWRQINLPLVSCLDYILNLILQGFFYYTYTYIFFHDKLLKTPFCAIFHLKISRKPCSGWESSTCVQTGLWMHSLLTCSDMINCSLCWCFTYRK